MDSVSSRQFREFRDRGKSLALYYYYIIFSYYTIQIYLIYLMCYLL